MIGHAMSEKGLKADTKTFDFNKWKSRFNCLGSRIVDGADAGEVKDGTIRRSVLDRLTLRYPLW